MNDVNGIRLQKNDRLSPAEAGWIEVLRSIFPAGVPRMTLRTAQVLRFAMENVS